MVIALPMRLWVRMMAKFVICWFQGRGNLALRQQFGGFESKREKVVMAGLILGLSDRFEIRSNSSRFYLLPISTTSSSYLLLSEAPTTRWVARQGLQAMIHRPHGRDRSPRLSPISKPVEIPEKSTGDDMPQGSASLG